MPLTKMSISKLSFVLVLCTGNVASAQIKPPMAPMTPKIAVPKPTVKVPTTATAGRVATTTPKVTANTQASARVNAAAQANANAQATVHANANASSAASQQQPVSVNTQQAINSQHVLGAVGQTGVRGGTPPLTSQSPLAMGGGSGIGSLQKPLNLTNSQLSQINQFQTNYTQELSSLKNRFASDPQGTQSLAQQAGQQLQQQVQSVLTPQQRVTLTQLTGTPSAFSANSSFPNIGTNGPANGVNQLNSINNNSTNASALRQSQLATGTSNSFAGAGITSAGTTQPYVPYSLKNGGFSGLGDATLQQKLNLNTSQVSQLRQFQLNYNQQLGEISNHFRTDPQGASTLLSNARIQSQQQINSVLSPQQQQILSSYTGNVDPNTVTTGLQAPVTGE